MAKLNKTEQDAIRKMRTECLRVKLIAAGQDEEVICGTDRPNLMEMWAELVATGADKPIAGAAANATTEKSRVKAEQLRFRQEAEKLTLKTAELAQNEQEIKLLENENAFRIAESERLEKAAANELAAKTKIAVLR